MARRIRRADQTTVEPYMVHGAEWAIEKEAYDPWEEAEVDATVEGIDPEVLDRLLDQLAFHAPRETDVLELRAKGARLEDIAYVLCPEAPLTQQSLSHLTHAGIRRLKVLVWLNSLGLDEATVVDVARLVGSSERDAETVRMVWRVQSYAGAARLLDGRTEIAIRHAFYAWARKVQRWPDPDDRVEKCRAWIAGFKSGALRAQAPWSNERRAQSRGPLVRPNRRWKKP